MLSARPLTAKSKRPLDHPNELNDHPAKAHKCQTELPKPPAKPPTSKGKRPLDHSDEPIDPPAKAHKCQTELPKPPAKPPTSKGKRAPYHRAEAHDHPVEPPKYQVEAHKRQAESPGPPAEAPGNKSKRPLDHLAKSPGSPAKAPKSQAEAPKRPAKTAPWVEEYKSWAKAQNRPAEARNRLNGPYCDIYTCIYSDEVDADAANDDSDGDEIADRAKYDMHSGQMFCVTCWACPDCRHHCLLIELNILHKSHPDLIQLYKDQLKTHLIKNSRYRLN